MKLQYLGHEKLGVSDECCHALVAKNLLSHPFKPTLIDTPYLPIVREDWGANHVWLHKPILPLWQIAVSYLVFGINTWALRLPSVILSTGAIWLIYLIGRDLLSREAGLIAATIMAFSPFLMELIHGYQFSDAIDISLLFWTELSIYFLVRALRNGRWLDVGIAGFGQGCAFLSKSYLALIVTGLSVVAWLAPALGMGKHSETHFQGKHVLGLMGAFLLTALPWTLWTAIRFPIEFHYEHLYTWLHLTTNIENLAAPWHKVVLVYGARMYGNFYIPIWIEVTNQNRNHHTLSETAKFAQTQLPHNAVLLVDIDTKTKLNQDDHLRLMFLCNKTAHPFYQKEAWEEKAKQVRKVGGIPYLVSFREWPLTVVFRSQTDERTIYYDSLEMADETP